MAVHFVISTTSKVVANTSGDIWIVSPGIYVTPTNDPAIDGSGTNGSKTFLIEGTLVGDNSHGILLGDTGTNATDGNNRVHVKSSGTIMADDTGILGYGQNMFVQNEGTIIATQNGIQNYETGAVITNSGSIKSYALYGIATSSYSSQTNTGTITGQIAGMTSASNSELLNFGTVVSVEAHGLWTGDNATAVNHGTIAAQDNGILMGAGGSATNTGKITVSSYQYQDTPSGISLVGANGSAINSGEIHVTGATASFDVPLANPAAAYGIYGVGDNQFIHNTGTISASNVGEKSGAAVKAQGPAGIFVVSQANENHRIINEGTISSTGSSILAGDGNETVTNKGSLTGQVYLGGGNDLFNGEGGTLSTGSNIYLEDGDDLFYGGSGRETVYGGGGNDTMFGNDGKDRLYDGSGNDEVEGGANNDYFRVGGGEDSYFGGDGKDYISYYDSSGGVTLDLQANTASRSWANNDTIEGFESASGSKTGDDRIYGTDTANTIQTYGGNDRLYGREGNDRLLGGDGNDTLYGASGGDKLYGGDGEDRLDGGAGTGTDTLYGGADADNFHFDRGEGYDIVKDFQNNVDEIQFDNFSYLTDAASALTYATEVSGDVLFDFGTDGQLLVENATKAQLLNDIAIV